MRTILRRALLGLVLASALLSQNVTCPVEGGMTYFTGTTKVDVSGKQLWLYRCVQFGHEFWVAR
jgi:hypothetical protein